MKLNDKIDEMFVLRERKRARETEIKEINAKISECEKWLLGRLSEVGTTTARGLRASITVTESLVPQIEDWGKVSDWVKENDAIYLLHRRISVGPWKELLDAGEEVPGINPFKKTGIALRKLSD